MSSWMYSIKRQMCYLVVSTWACSSMNFMVQMFVTTYFNHNYSFIVNAWLIKLVSISSSLWTGWLKIMYIVSFDREFFLVFETYVWSKIFPIKIHSHRNCFLISNGHSCPVNLNLDPVSLNSELVNSKPDIRQS